MSPDVRSPVRSLCLAAMSAIVLTLIPATATARPTPGPYPPPVERVTIVEEKAMMREFRAQQRAEAAEARTVTTAQEAEPEPVTPPAPQPAMSINWDVLAECESHGEWDYGPHSGWGSGIFEGGLQFHPGTWDAYKLAGYPEAAYQASREQQIVVAEKVLAAQGLGAWPACTRKLGWR